MSTSASLIIDMRNALVGLVRGQFFRNVAMVLSGAALAQLITVLFSPVISRLFTPADFGVLGSFMALVAFAGPIATMSFSSAIVLPRQEEDATALAWLCLLISAGTSILSLVAIALFRLTEGRYFAGMLDNLLFLLPLAIFFEGLFQVAQQWMLREKLYRLSAQINVAQAAISTGIKVAAGIFFPTGSSLVLTSLLATPINAVSLAFSLNYLSAPVRWPKRIRSSSIQAAARKFADFPLYRMPQSLFNVSAQGIPLLVVVSYYGVTIAGFFTLTNTVLNAPTWLLSKTVSDVFFPRLVDATHRREPITPLIIKATGALAAVSSVPLGTLMFAGPQIFALFFGLKWFEAGQYAQWLSLLTLITLTMRPLLSALPMLKLQGTYLIFEIVSSVIKLLSVWLAAKAAVEPTSAIAIFALTGSIVQLPFCGFVLLKARRYDSKTREQASD